MSKIIYTIKPATCPKCHGRIQATEEQYLDSRDNGNGTASVFVCDANGERRWYCVNDHPVDVELVEGGA